MTGPRCRPAVGAGVLVLVLLSSCGLPGSGSAREVDDDTVPTGLLAPDPPPSSAPEANGAPGPVPVVFWLLDEDRLSPSATDSSCTESPEAIVARLLDELAAGPTDEARTDGRSTAIPPESPPTLVDISAGTAQVDVDPETSISADLLPAAVGQIVLTVTSAPEVRSVALVSDGDPVQLPLPGGALTDGPVTADDYAALVHERFRQGDVGCPAP